MVSKLWSDGVWVGLKGMCALERSHLVFLISKILGNQNAAVFALAIQSVGGMGGNPAILGAVIISSAPGVAQMLVVSGL